MVLVADVVINSADKHYAMADDYAPPAELASLCCKFLDETPTPFHLCVESGAMLKAAGFTDSELAVDTPARELGGPRPSRPSPSKRRPSASSSSAVDA